MSVHYLIRKGSRLKVTANPVVEAELMAEIARIFEKHSCLLAYSVFSMRQGLIFAKTNKVLCLVYQNQSLYEVAYSEIARALEAYFRSHPGFMDYIPLNLENSEHRQVISILESKITFRKKPS
jgi:hypothetical protein